MQPVHKTNVSDAPLNNGGRDESVQNKDCQNEPLLDITAAALRQRRGTVPLLIVVTGLLSQLALAAVEPAAEEAPSFLASGLLMAVGILALAALGVTVVTRWSSKQDHMNEMVCFCMGFLIDSDRVPEGQAAAKALGRFNDPRAILVLLDVVNDQQADETLRKTAADALSVLGSDYRKYKQVIDELMSASEQRDDARLIEILTLNFEKSGAEYVQSAYVIGRCYVRQGHYADAKEWFRVAAVRNDVTPFYGDQIRQLVVECDRRLFAKGDELFKSSDYHQARERYSAASHGLSDEENLRYSGFLRLACVYCKLGDYDAADQAVLLALKKDQKTEMSLLLNKLLQQVLDGHHSRASPQRQRVVSEIDNLTTEIMKKLYVATTDQTGGKTQPPNG